jgi:hypothetical protein
VAFGKEGKKLTSLLSEEVKGGLEILGNLSFQGFVGGLGVLLAYRHEYEAAQWRFMPFLHRFKFSDTESGWSGFSLPSLKKVRD